MQYAKLENGYLIPAPGEVRQGGMVIMNPGLEILGPMGYKPVEYTERPEITTPGNDLREVYTEEADRIRVGAAARSRTVAGNGLPGRSGSISDGLRGLSGRGQDTRSRRAEGPIPGKEGRD